jgi:hypothetical protein
MLSSHGQAFGAVIGLLAATLPSWTAMAAPGARLVYSRTADAESCPDEDALRRAVAARVGYDAFFPWAKRTITATITRTEGACGELLDAVALAVAIAIDPRLVLAGPTATTPEPRGEDAAAATTTPSEDATPAPLPVEEEGRIVPPKSSNVGSVSAPPAPDTAASATARTPGPLAFEGSLGAAGSIGVAPEPSFGGTLGAAVRWRRYSLGVEGFIAAPLTRSASGGGSISSWPLLVTLDPCVYVGPVFGCALAQTGAVFATAAGVDARATSSAWWAAGGRVGFVARAWKSLFVRFRVDVLGDLSPARLMFNGQGQWPAPLVAGSAGVDAVVRFP